MKVVGLEKIVKEQSFSFENKATQISIKRINGELYLSETHSTPNELISDSLTKYGRDVILGQEYDKLIDKVSLQYSNYEGSIKE